MATFKETLLSSARIAAFGIAALVSIFAMREFVLSEFQAQSSPEREAVHPARDFADCMETLPPPMYRIIRPQTESRYRVRVVDRSDNFAAITVARPVTGVWVFVVDFRGDLQQVYEARMRPHPVLMSVRERAAHNHVTDVLSSCGAEFLGPIPVPEQEWSAYFDDPFFDGYRLWNGRR